MSRHGYVSLLTGRALQRGDDVPMVAARARFLRAGHFAPMTEALAAAAVEELSSSRGQVVVDAGAGTGWHLAHVLDRAKGACGLALDASKFASRRAARAHPHLVSVVADIEAKLPVMDHGARLALSVFAPRNAPELARILHPDGALIVVAPGSDHFANFRRALRLLDVDRRKDERLLAKMTPWFRCDGHRDVQFKVRLSAHELEDWIAMGPNARHVTLDEIRRRVHALHADPMIDWAHCRIWRFRPRGDR